MKIIYRDYLINDFNLEKSALTIGNFDGCHKGHQKLIINTVEYAQKNLCDSVVITFLPTSKEYFFYSKNYLTNNDIGKNNNILTFEQKLKIFEEMGVDIVIIDKFDNYLSKLSAEEYYVNYIQKLNPIFICVGEDFCFGYKQSGSIDFFLKKSKQQGYFVDIIKTLYFQQYPIKSSAIRAFLKEGKIEIADIMLGRPYVIEGIICKGEQLARKLGFPTTNLNNVTQILPKDGVYCGYVVLNQDINFKFSILKLNKYAIPAVFHIGRMTNHSQDIKIEAHLLQGEYGENALYGYKAAYYFTHKIRDRKFFNNMSELVLTIKQDILNAKKILSI